LLACGLIVVTLGVILPRGWYDSLPWDAELPRPGLRGVTVLQAALVLSGLLIALLGWLGWRPAWGSAGGRGRGPSWPESREIDSRTAGLLLLGITLFALALRLWRLDADLWLDEITPIAYYRDYSILEILATYVSSNNHLLNTLLVKGTTAVFGEQEWAARLPAVGFGVATIPVLYGVVRLAGSRLESLAAALLLALSYHHIFFSQSARGYTAYLFFSLAATGLLLRGLQRDDRASWLLYLATMLGNFAALLQSAFVAGGHVLTGAIAVWQRRRGGEDPRPLLRRLAGVFCASALLGFLLYASILPQAFVVIGTVYRNAGSGFKLASGEFITDLLAGLREGLGAGVFVLPLLALLLGYGFLVLLRRSPFLGLGLASPLVLIAGLLGLRGLSVSPRFFLLGVPLAIVAVVLALSELARIVAAKLPLPRPRLAGTFFGLALAVLAVSSLAALPRYYATPKQPYRAALAELIERRDSGDIIVLIQTAEHGFRFYATRAGLEEGRDFVVVRSLSALEEVVRSRGAEHTILVTTFRRVLRLGAPDLHQRIEADWVPARRFPAAIHDGTIAIWEARRG